MLNPMLVTEEAFDWQAGACCTFRAALSRGYVQHPPRNEQVIGLEVHYAGLFSKRCSQLLADIKQTPFVISEDVIE
jgi:hypothetical protein